MMKSNIKWQSFEWVYPQKTLRRARTFWKEMANNKFRRWQKQTSSVWKHSAERMNWRRVTTKPNSAHVHNLKWTQVWPGLLVHVWDNGKLLQVLNMSLLDRWSQLWLVIPPNNSEHTKNRVDSEREDWFKWTKCRQRRHWK